MSNLKFMGEATDYIMMGKPEKEITRDDLDGMNKAVGNMNSYMGYVKETVENMDKSVAEMNRAMKKNRKKGIAKKSRMTQTTMNSISESMVNVRKDLGYMNKDMEMINKTMGSLNSTVKGIEGVGSKNKMKRVKFKKRRYV